MMKKIIYILIFSVLFAGCKKKDVPTYSGESYVQFEGEKFVEINHSFVYSGKEATRDTLYIECRAMGATVDYDRYLKLRQVPEYTMEYEYNDNGYKIDSVLVEMGDQAIAGQHFVAFESPEAEKLLVIKKGCITSKIGIILLRDISLKEYLNGVRLNFEIIPSDDFKVGEVRAYKARVVVGDRLFMPTGWNKYYNGGLHGAKPNYSSVFGWYGPVKHQFMIDATDYRWDTGFFTMINKEHDAVLYTYQSELIEKLAIYNAKRATDGLLPLRENPNDPATEVTFIVK